MYELRVVFDNVPLTPGLEPGWGFAALVTGYERTVLFDTGSDGNLLLGNMKALEMAASGIGVVFISHPHDDHLGGLDRLLLENADVEVLLPDGTPPEVVDRIEEQGAMPVLVDEGGQIMEGVWSTGTMQAIAPEQGLVLEGEMGVTLVTGCAHPGVVAMVEAAGALVERPIDLVVGGFHLCEGSRRDAQAAAEKLRSLGVRTAAPSHCSGDACIGAFREVFGDGFVESGLGRTVPLP